MLLSGLFVTFLKEFGIGVWLTLPLWLTLLIGIIVLGQVVRRLEGWAAFDGFYWSLVTATTVGYGDIRPTRSASRLIAIAIALLGLTFTGILIAVAVHAATVALVAHEVAAKV